MSSPSTSPSSTTKQRRRITVIHCWSAPRSRSTALLYSFQSRSDCHGLDEPLSRDWLIDNPHQFRPYRDMMVNGGDSDSANGGSGWREQAKGLDNRLLAQIYAIDNSNANNSDDDNSSGDSIVFVKHLAKHAPHFDFKTNSQRKHKQNTTDDNMSSSSSSSHSDDSIVFVKYMAEHAPTTGDNVTSSSSSIHNHSHSNIRHVHMLLIRDPISMLKSWDHSSGVTNSSASILDVGITPLLDIYAQVKAYGDGDETLNANNGIVAVVDAEELANDPSTTLKHLCHDLGIGYTDQMLTWDKGPKDCDGPWAKWWYANVHKSTGWNVNITADAGGGPNVGIGTGKYKTMSPKLMPALRASLPVYDYLIKVTHMYKNRAIDASAPSAAAAAEPNTSIYEDPRNEHVLVYIGQKGQGRMSMGKDNGNGNVGVASGRLVPRDMAAISPFDSSVQGGDATWEGIRVYRGKILSLERHLKRLFKSAKALGFQNIHTKEDIIHAIFQTLAVNGMRDGVHMRLTLTRGEKCTSSMNPVFNVYGTTLIVLAEWKPTEGKTTYDNSKGISLITSSARRNSPSTCDSKIHHNNMINNILPKIQANLAGAADALMLDLNGFVSETNATNVFMVEDGVLMTPHADHCLPGITRETILILAKEIGIETEVRNISLAEFHAADEVFTSGTMGELTPVTMIDGRVIGTGMRGAVTARLQEVYSNLPERPGWSTAIPPFE